MVIVNGKEVKFRAGMTVGDALKDAGVNIDDMTLVMVNGKIFLSSCVYNELINDGDEIKSMLIISGG